MFKTDTNKEMGSLCIILYTVKLSLALSKFYKGHRFLLLLLSSFFFFTYNEMLLFLFSLAHLGTYFQWTEEELEANWKREPMNIQQRIADKCRNLNKKKKN